MENTNTENMDLAQNASILSYLTNLVTVKIKLQISWRTKITWSPRAQRQIIAFFGFPYYVLIIAEVVA